MSESSRWWNQKLQKLRIYSMKTCRMNYEFIFIRSNNWTTQMHLWCLQIPFNCIDSTKHWQPALASGAVSSLNFFSCTAQKSHHLNSSWKRKWSNKRRWKMLWQENGKNALCSSVFHIRLFPYPKCKFMRKLFRISEKLCSASPSPCQWCQCS